MKSFFFENQTKIDSSERLEKITGLSGFVFDDDAVLTFEGKISLSPGIHFRGKCNFDDGVSIDTGCILTNVSIGKDSKIRNNSTLENSRFGKNNIIGPFCFVRDNSIVGDLCIVGSYVEVARSNLGSDVKISHQAFIGDAIIDKSVIIGAGVVFCNYDGVSKQSSIIKEGVTVGSGSMIVSPVTIGRESIIGAGSVVTEDIGVKERYIQKRN